MIINNYKERTNSKNFSPRNNNVLTETSNNNNNNSPINDEKKFIRRNSRRRSTKKISNLMQNLNISFDDLLRHLNFFEFFFDMELVKINIKYN